MKEVLKFIFSRQFLRHLAIAFGSLLVLWIVLMVWLRFYTRHNEAYPVPDFKGLSIEEAGKLAFSRKLRFQIADSVFIREAQRGTIVDQNPQPGFKVKLNRTIFLTINAFSIPKIPMPQVVGVSVRQAQAILEAKGLKIGKLVYVPDFAQNNVLEQRFEGRSVIVNQLIDKGSSVDLVVGRGYSDQLTSVPKLVGQSKTKAENRIVSLYLNLGAVIYDQTLSTSADTLNALIWKQLPDPGRKVNLGSFVDIWLTVDSAKVAEADSLIINRMEKDE